MKVYEIGVIGHPHSLNPATVGCTSRTEAAEHIWRALHKFPDSVVTVKRSENNLFGPNERGLAQMGGNVTEWVHDLYTIYPSGNAGVARDPTGPEEGELHTIRGSSWMDSSISELRLTYRDYGKKARRDLGFRIVRYAE